MTESRNEINMDALDSITHRVLDYRQPWSKVAADKPRDTPPTAQQETDKTQKNLKSE